MKKSHKTIIWIFVIVIAAVWATSIVMRGLDKPQATNDDVSAEVPNFAESMQNFVIENFGHPIDSGFTASMYLRAFPGLLEADFDGVETSEGAYKYSGGELTFIKTPTGRYSTFDEAI